MALDDEAKLLEQLAAAIEEERTAEPLELIALLSDQPFATVPVPTPEGLQRVGVMMALRPDVAPGRFAATTLVNSPASSNGVITMEPAIPFGGVPSPVLIEAVGVPRTLAEVRPEDLLDPAAFRQPLQNARESVHAVLRANTDGDVNVVRRIEEHADDILRRTAFPVFDLAAPEAARLCTPGFEAIAAYGVRLVARRPEHRERFRLCAQCHEEPVFTPRRRGDVRELCVRCRSRAGRARDERKRLRRVLRNAGCPQNALVAQRVWGNGFRTVAELHDALDTSRPRIESLIRPSVDRAFSTPRERRVALEDILLRLATARRRPPYR